MQTTFNICSVMNIMTTTLKPISNMTLAQSLHRKLATTLVASVTLALLKFFLVKYVF